MSGGYKMEYTVQKLGKLAGISTRTLRYYDEIGILKPARINSSGYRIYGNREVDLLQQILFYRELGFNLEDIKEIILSSDFEPTKALREHHERLLARRRQLDMLIANVEKTLASAEGSMFMSDKEKFEGFKDKLIKENEEKYGSEIRKKYGDEKVDNSNQKYKNMTNEQYEAFKKLENEVLETLQAAIKEGRPEGQLAQRAAELHKEWLCYTWDKYSKEAHIGLAHMYVEDERFKAYYDKVQAGAAEFLRDAILIYTKSRPN